MHDLIAQPVLPGRVTEALQEEEAGVGWVPRRETASLGRWAGLAISPKSLCLRIQLISTVWAGLGWELSSS